MEDPRTMQDAARRLPALQKRLETLQADLQRAESEAAELLYQYEKEKRDVEHMQKESFSNFALRVMGRFDARAEKERGEEMAAKARYDKARARRDGLGQDLARLRAGVQESQAAARQYQAFLERRRDSLALDAGSPAALRLQALEAERQRLTDQVVEVDEALAATGRAAATANQVAASLDSAEGWASYDVWVGKGLFSHMAKYQQIDDAEAAFNTLAAQLAQLRAELADVEGFAAPEFQGISTGQRAVDFWFDNIFTDLSVRGQIRDNQDRARQLLSALRQVAAALEERRRRLGRELDDNAGLQEEALVQGQGCTEI